MPKYDLVVFDLAGTTVHDDQDVTNALRATLKERVNFDATLAEANRVMGRAKEVSIADLLTVHGQPHSPTDPLVLDLLNDFEDRMVAHYLRSPDAREVAGATETFRALRAMGVKVTVDTGFSRKVATAIMTRLGWERDALLDAWITVDDVREGRPAPFMIFHLMEQTGIADVSRVVKVGDTPSDLNMGRNARVGLNIGVLSGSHTREELAKHPHDLLLPDVTHLPALLS